MRFSMLICVFTLALSQARGANWVKIYDPTVVSIYNIESMANDTLHIMDLNHSSARNRCGGVGANLVAFFDHGIPVGNVYAPAGKEKETGFLEVYWDRDNNGGPYETVRALDLQSQTDVWITWGLQNNLTIRYLRPGQRISVEITPGQWQNQTVYHPTIRAENPGSGVVGCERSRFSARGGHRDVHAYDMSQMWP